MAVAEPTFAPEAYVVRYGQRGLLGNLAALLVGSAVTVFVLVSGRPVLTDVIVLVIEAGLLIAFGVDLSRAARREVMFAVGPDGVYFGSDVVKETVPWDRVCAVEFFTETVQGARSRSVYRCVGVRALGSRQTARPGSGAAAQPLAARSAKYMIDAGRPDLLPGADGTIRYAYRRMRGWRVDRQKLAEAVARFAPAIPVVNGPNWPPEITGADALAARRARRTGGRGGS